MKTENKSCCIWLIILAIFYIPVVLWTDRNLDFWVSHLKGEIIDVPIWVSMILSLCQPILFLDILGELVRLFL